MSTTTNQPTTTAVPAADRGANHVGEPQSWRSDEDAKGWKVIARGQRRPEGAPAPLIRLTMDLDSEQSAWLRQEAERTALGYDELMLKLLDHARTQAAPAAPSARQIKGARSRRPARPRRTQ